MLDEGLIACFLGLIECWLHVFRCLKLDLEESLFFSSSFPSQRLHVSIAILSIYFTPSSYSDFSAARSPARLLSHVLIFEMRRRSLRSDPIHSSA